MRHIKYAPRLTPINEDLTASMMFLKQRGSGVDPSKSDPLHHKRRVVEIVRVVGAAADRTRAAPSKDATTVIVAPPKAENESVETAAEPVTLQPLRNRADTALTAPPPAVLERTASGRVENKYGRSALHDAVRRGDVGAVKHLVATQPELLRRADIRGNQPLHYAANCTSPHAAEIVYVLLKAGAFVNATNERQQTPLLIHVIACRADDDMVVRILLHHSAKPRIKMTEDMMLSHYAASRGLHKIAAALSEYM